MASIDFSGFIVYTGRIHIRSMAAFDITVMTGNTAFSPTWEMVRGIKGGTMDRETYTKLYLDILDRSIVANRREWLKLKEKGLIIAECYCKAGEFCHRLLFAEYLVKLGAKYRGEVVELNGSLYANGKPL